MTTNQLSRHKRQRIVIREIATHLLASIYPNLCAIITQWQVETEEHKALLVGSAVNSAVEVAEILADAIEARYGDERS